MPESPGTDDPGSATPGPRPDNAPARSHRRRMVGSGDARLEASSRGMGEPLLLIRTALSVDHLEPLAAQPALADRYRIITYDRRGYGVSTPSTGPGSIDRDALDALAVLDAHGVGRAHVFGDSFSAAIALQLALTASARVRTLILVEPPPVHVPGAEAFRATNLDLIATYQARGALAALEVFMPRLAGSDWRADYDRAVPGMSRRIEQDAATFFATDAPALLEWRVAPGQTVGIGCPVLHIGGSDSGPLFAGVQDWVLGLLPGARTCVISGAGHDVSLTHPREVAEAVAEFLTR